MTGALDDILAARRQEPGHVGQLLTMSFALHLVAIAALVLVPRMWFAHRAPVAPIMMVSLAGDAGPKLLGLSTVGARPVEQAAPPPKRRAIIEPAAAKPKSMSEPIKTAEKTKPPTPDPAKSPPKPAAAEVLQNYYSAETTSSVRKPVAGPKPAPGTSIAETGVQGLGAGLSSGGTGGVTLDVPFCCMDYVQVVVDKIREQWQNQPVKGTNIVKFTIEKSGAIDPTSIQIEQTSRNDSLDGESKRALYLARLPPLPQPFTGPRLTVHLTVVYGGS